MAKEAEHGDHFLSLPMFLAAWVLSAPALIFLAVGLELILRGRTHSSWFQSIVDDDRPLQEKLGFSRKAKGENDAPGSRRA